MTVELGPDVPRLLLRIEEAAQRMGIGRSLMYQMVLSGRVESVHVGRLRRIPAECLEEAVAQLRVLERERDGAA